MAWTCTEDFMVLVLTFDPLWLLLISIFILSSFCFGLESNKLFASCRKSWKSSWISCIGFSFVPIGCEETTLSLHKFKSTSEKCWWQLSQAKAVKKAHHRSSPKHGSYSVTCSSLYSDWGSTFGQIWIFNNDNFVINLSIRQMLLYFLYYLLYGRVSIIYCCW